MCDFHRYLWHSCRHITHHTQTCLVYPLCSLLIQPMEDRPFFCPPCRVNRDGQWNSPRYTQTLREGRAANQTVRVSGQQADSFAAPEAPSASSPNNSDPHITALRMHRQTIEELENGHQHIVEGFVNGPRGNRSPGRADDIAELVHSLHVPLADLNRQYVRELNHMIEILESFEDQAQLERALPVDRDLPRDRTIPAERDARLQNLPDSPPRCESRFMAPLSLRSLRESERQCTICIQRIGDADEDGYAVRLSCGHVFGNLCIDRWLASHGTCPVCRRDYSSEL
jgi:hypothetical protein